MALVHRDEDLKLTMPWHGIYRTEEVVERVREASEVATFHLAIIGGGTNSGPVVSAVRDFMPSLGILVVDEQNTTLQARERYWEFNKRRGWRKLLPASLQSPPEPVDDYVAFILAERVLLGG